MENNTARQDHYRTLCARRDAITILESARKSISLDDAGAEEWGAYNLISNAIVHMFNLPGFGALDIQFAHEDKDIWMGEVAA